jgi:hypothetical protein
VAIALRGNPESINQACIDEFLKTFPKLYPVT